MVCGAPLTFMRVFGNCSRGEEMLPCASRSRYEWGRGSRPNLRFSVIRKGVSRDEFGNV